MPTPHREVVRWVAAYGVLTSSSDTASDRTDPIEIGAYGGLQCTLIICNPLLRDAATRHCLGLDPKLPLKMALTRCR